MEHIQLYVPSSAELVAVVDKVESQVFERSPSLVGSPPFRDVYVFPRVLTSVTRTANVPKSYLSLYECECVAESGGMVLTKAFQLSNGATAF